MSVFEKLDFKSKDNVTENLIFLNNHFKGVVTETAEGLKINKELLLQKISKELVEGSQEKYELNWPGKRKAQLAANIQTDKTLEPVIEDSVDFENTENLYIEGDNLEVLKILQESYTGKIKCIYIDPPYNTGKDFVYKDSFDQDKKDYLTETNQLDEEGGRLVSNPETSGRYHSNWLSMMYPRLQLARNLLSEDGVIFISIDDNEVHNLRKVCDEIFGEENFVSELVWRKKTGASDTKAFSTITESIIVFCKSIEKIDSSITKDTESFDPKRYKLKDEYFDRRGPHYIDNLDRGGIQYSDSLNYPIISPDGGEIWPNGRKSFLNDGWIWTWGKEKVSWGLNNGFITFKKVGNDWRVYYKNYLYVNNKDELYERSSPHKNLILDIINTSATLEMSKLFNTKVFQYTKPTELIKKIVKYVYGNQIIILDFFSGSSTTAHSVMKLNSEDGGKRKYIMVQIPEKTQEDSEANKAGYKNICEIGKERIRRAAKKIKEETNADIDYGFRVLKLTDSVYNKETFKSPKDTNIDSLFENNLRENITSDSLLFATLLDLGLPLSYKFEIKNIENKKTYFVEENSLICCFENNLDNSIITKLLENNPMYLVLLDSSFNSDQDKINIKNKLQELNLRTTIKVI